MRHLAFVFPGQGAQEVGMGKALAEAYPDAMAVWEEAERALGLPVRAMAWEGTAEELSRTNVTQPTLLTAEVSVLRVLQKAGFHAVATAGHSLGEYAARVAAEALSFGDAVRIVRIRGDAMQTAAQTSEGGMAAVIGGDEAALETLCAEIGDIAPANLNAPGQIVVSGSDRGLKALEERAREIRARRVIRLNVAGPFHSPAMADAAEAVESALAGTAIGSPVIPVYANVTAQAQEGPAEIRANLKAQVVGRVRWVETIHNMKASGIRDFVELGPGKVLAGLIHRIDADASVFSVGEPASVDALKEAMKQ